LNQLVSQKKNKKKISSFRTPDIYSTRYIDSVHLHSHSLYGHIVKGHMLEMICACFKAICLHLSKTHIKKL